MFISPRSPLTVSPTFVLDNENAMKKNFPSQTELNVYKDDCRRKIDFKKKPHAMQIHKLNSQCSQLIQYIRNLAILNKGSWNILIQANCVFLPRNSFSTQYKIDGLAPKLFMQIVNYENSLLLLMAAEQKLPIWNEFVLWSFKSFRTRFKEWPFRIWFSE